MWSRACPLATGGRGRAGAAAPAELLHEEERCTYGWRKSDFLQVLVGKMTLRLGNMERIGCQSVALAYAFVR